MRVAIVGFGLEGQSALQYWQSHGAEVVVCDQKTDLELPDGVTGQLGDHYLDNLDRFDVISRTAGMHPKLILQANPSVGPKITTVMNEFLRVCPTKNVIGITGTKGKGTTSTLTAKILEALGKQVFLGGNIGTSPFDFLPDLAADSWVVLEMSSFQLQDLKYSPHIAVCLMIAPEHLNWHSDYEDYKRAKAQLFAHQTNKDIAIYFANNNDSHQIASVSPGAKIAYFAEPGAYIRDDEIVIDNQVICNVHDLKLIGKHHWQNVCAAATIVWQIAQDATAIKSVVTTFSGLPHRLELIRTVDGVDYYDDSLATIPDAAITAIEAFEQPKVIILGGSDKGTPFDGLAQVVAKSNVRQAILIGDTAPTIAAALRAAGFEAISHGGSTMEQIVATAHQHAKSGDVVLLSPACASFGMFTDYKDRSKQFQLAVGAL